MKNWIGLVTLFTALLNVTIAFGQHNRELAPTHSREMPAPINEPAPLLAQPTMPPIIRSTPPASPVRRTVTPRPHRPVATRQTPPNHPAPTRPSVDPETVPICLTDPSENYTKIAECERGPRGYCEQVPSGIRVTPIEHLEGENLRNAYATLVALNHDPGVESTPRELRRQLCIVFGQTENCELSVVQRRRYTVADYGTATCRAWPQNQPSGEVVCSTTSVILPTAIIQARASFDNPRTNVVCVVRIGYDGRVPPIDLRTLTNRHQ